MTLDTDPDAPKLGNTGQLKRLRSWLGTRKSLVVLGVLYAISFVVIWLLYGDPLPLWADVLIVAAPIAVAWLLSESLKKNWAQLPRWIAFLVVVVPALAIIWIAYRTFSGLPTKGLGFVAFITGIVVIGQLVSALRAFLADKPTSPIFIG